MTAQREKKLQVKNLRISFRTTAGKVQAVRGISFDLYKGETLAIVGESGSGKSVTSRAILGILAANAMVEGGRILYAGQDLLKISEEDFHHIRGDKIAMVFQDPMSSLNPIMRIGKQLTEAMRIKNRTGRRESRRAYRATIRALAQAVQKAAGQPDANQLFDRFRTILRRQASLEEPYDRAVENAKAAARLCSELGQALEKDAATNLKADCRELEHLARGALNLYLVPPGKTELENLAGALTRQAHAALADKQTQPLRQTLCGLGDILDAALALGDPDFYGLACWAVVEGKPLPETGDRETLKALSQSPARQQFDRGFLDCAKAGVAWSHGQAQTARKAAAAAIRAQLPVFTAKGPLEQTKAKQAAAALFQATDRAQDPLEPVKDSLVGTFRGSLTAALEDYFQAVRANTKERRRFDRQTARYEKKAAAGHAPEGQVAPLALVDLEEAKQDMAALLTDLADHLEALAADPETGFDARGKALMNRLQTCALEAVHKVTRAMAKASAIRLMQSVGIPQAAKRYYQYPFAFSGGMRQRIVIAIALTANPDVLICDEPTTALDVTIQAQILELLGQLKRERQLSVIFITHDLGVVANMADRIAVMYAGRFVEVGTADEVFYQPAHPYTWALLSAVPDLDTGERLEFIPGTPPNMIYPPAGDAFAPRNRYAMEIDFEAQPPMFPITHTHAAATWLLHPDAPKVQPPQIVLDRISRMKQKGGGAE